MAKFRRGTKRKRTFKRRKSYRRGTNRRFQRRVKRVINQTAEKKALDGASNGNINGVTGTFIFPGAALTQGTGGNQRIGNQVRIRSLKVNFILQGPNLGGTTQRITVLVGAFRDYQLATPDVNTFFQYPTNVVAYSPYLREPLQNKEWVPMYLKTHFLVPWNAVGGYYPNEKLVKLSFSGKKLPKKLKTFNAGGYSNWQYFIMFFTADVVNQAIHVTNWRITYTDV